MPIVYIIQDNGKNFESARKFGDFQVILRGNEPADIAAGKLRRALSNFTNADFLILTGHPINIGLAMFYALKATEDGTAVQLLDWSKETLSYNLERIIP